MFERLFPDYRPFFANTLITPLNKRALRKISCAWRHADRWVDMLPDEHPGTDLEKARRTLQAAGKVCSKHFVATPFGDQPLNEENLTAVQNMLLSALISAPGHPGIFYDATKLLLELVIPNVPDDLRSQAVNFVERVEHGWPAMFWSTRYTIKLEHEVLENSGIATKVADRLFIGSLDELMTKPVEIGSSEHLELATRAVYACPMNHNAWFQLRYQLGVRKKHLPEIENLELRLRGVSHGLQADTWLYDDAKDRERETQYPNR